MGTFIIIVLVIIGHLSIGAFGAQICVDRSRSACNDSRHRYCEHGGWYFIGILGVLLPGILLAILAAKKSGLGLTEKGRFEKELQEARHRTSLAQEQEREAQALAQARLAEIEGLNAELKALKIDPPPVGDMR